MWGPSSLAGPTLVPGRPDAQLPYVDFHLNDIDPRVDRRGSVGPAEVRPFWSLPPTNLEGFRLPYRADPGTLGFGLE